MKLSVSCVRGPLFAFVLACVTALPATSYADSHGAAAPVGVEEGRTRFNRGVDLYKEGNFHGALAEFRAAFAAAPSYRIHYNLGQTLYQLQDYAGAVRALDQYLAEGRDKLDADRIKDVEGDLAKLRPRIAKITFVVNVPNPEVTVDDEPRGTLENQELFVSGGRHRIAVTAPGYQTENRALDIAGAQQLELKFDLKPISTAAAADSRPQPLARPLVVAKRRTPFYIGAMATLVLGAGTGISAILASRRQSDYGKALGVVDNARGIDEARRATRSTALVADVFGGATVLAAGLTLIAYALTSGTERVTTTAASAAPRRPNWVPVVGPSSVGARCTF